MSLSKQWAMGLVSLCLACAFCATANAADPTEKELNDPAWWAKQAEKSLGELPLQAKDDPYTYVIRKQHRLTWLAGVYAKTGDDKGYRRCINAAEALMTALEYEEDKDEAYWHLAGAAAFGGKFEDAVNFANKCKEPIYRQDANIHVARYMFEKGEKEKATKLFDDNFAAMNEPDAYVIAVLVEYYVVAEKPENIIVKLKPTIEKISGKSNQAYAWSRAGRVLASQGLETEASLCLKTSNELLPDAKKEFDEFDEEEAWQKEDNGQTIVWPEDPLHIEEDLALANIWLGNEAYFKKLERVRTEENALGASAYAYASIALSLTKKDDLAKKYLAVALAIADKDKNPMDENWDIQVIGEAFALTGQHQKAHRWINNLSDSVSRGSGQVSMAYALLEKAEFEKQQKAKAGEME